MTACFENGKAGHSFSPASAVIQFLFYCLRRYEEIFRSGDTVEFYFNGDGTFIDGRYEARVIHGRVFHVARVPFRERIARYVFCRPVGITRNHLELRRIALAQGRDIGTNVQLGDFSIATTDGHSHCDSRESDCAERASCVHGCLHLIASVLSRYRATVN